MTHDRQGLRRAELIARVRLVEQRQATTDAALVEAERRKLVQLAERTRALAAQYDRRDTVQSAHDLRSASLLAVHLHELGQAAAVHAEWAKQDAEVRILAAATAERRHQKAEARRQALLRAWIERNGKFETTTRRNSGTHLDG